MKSIMLFIGRVAVALSLLIGAAASASDFDEIPATIVAVDVPGNAVTLAGLGITEARYRLAFDVQIKLLSGATGTANNLRPGDGVTALVDDSGKVVHALFVVAKSP